MVERDAQPLPQCGQETGVDVGLASLAVTSGGLVIPNPRFLRKAERRPGKAQRALSIKQKGTRNQTKARQRVAVLHRKVRERVKDGRQY